MHKLAALVLIVVAFSGNTQGQTVIVGNGTDLGTSTVSVANYLLGNKITVTEEMIFQSAGIIFDTRTYHGFSALAAVYSDQAGAPNQLVATTGLGSVNRSVIGGSQIDDQTFGFTTAPTVSAGDYWLLVAYTGTASVRYATGTAASVSYINFITGSSTPPSSFPTADRYVGHSFNYYVEGIPTSAIPEPSAYAGLMGALALGCVVSARRRRR